MKNTRRASKTIITEAGNQPTGISSLQKKRKKYASFENLQSIEVDLLKIRSLSRSTSIIKRGYGND